MHIPTPREVRDKRVKLGLTQTDVAKRSKLSQSMVARIEAATVDPRVSTLQKIVEVLLDAERSMITAGDLMHQPVICINSEKTLASTIEIMEMHGISQIPVIDEGVPVGCISESAIINAMEEGKINKTRDHLVSDFMEEGFPTVPPSTDIETIVHMLHNNHAVLVLEKGKVSGVITKHDLMSMIV